jgi:hypothetical protein
MRMSNYSEYKSEMSSIVRTVPTSLEVQSVTILASDLDDLAKNLSVQWGCFRFPVFSSDSYRMGFDHDVALTKASIERSFLEKFEEILAPDDRKDC